MGCGCQESIVAKSGGNEAPEEGVEGRYILPNHTSFLPSTLYSKLSFFCVGSEVIMVIVHHLVFDLFLSEMKPKLRPPWCTCEKR